MTYQDRDKSDSPEEIEVTPEMIEAGLFALSRFEEGDPKTQMVEAVFFARCVIRDANNYMHALQAFDELVNFI
ncbi:hypothetical protein QW131_23800 [Roseibium salinum]|nr:hypothetical protein [Roseibium salinum]